ncbi:unnamed protein product [Symbiodinium natans]|uniref:Pentatricopeptide repeat-containing protein, chloroplastic n=1 Tax=Symbiodinium natans TaxID=878477 RepID=A0A812TMG8_9DINO|nr:unnamed protein product [Symbiodinium natans]
MFCDGIKRVAIDCDLPAASCSCITACYPQATEDKSKTRPVVLQDALQKFEACQTGCADAAAVSSKLRSGSKQVYSKHQSCWYQQVERSVDELCPQPCSGHSWQEGVAIKAAGDAARWDLAVALLDLDCHHGRAALAHFGAAISVCAAARQWHHALAILQHMPKRHLDPDAACFGVVAGACERAGHHVLSSGLLAEMCRAPGQKRKTLTIGFTNAMSEACRGSHWDRALEHFSKAVDMRLVLDIPAYSAALAACQKGAAWRESMEILASLDKEVEASPSNAASLLVACSAALGACAHGGHWEHALKHLGLAQRLASQSQEASQPFLVAMHGAVGVFAEALHWELALDLLPRMQKEASRHTSVPLTTFRATNAALAACTRSLAWRKACQLVFPVPDGLDPPDLASSCASRSIGLFLASAAFEKSQVMHRSLRWMGRASKSWQSAKLAGSGMPSLAADLAPVAAALLNTASFCKDSFTRLFGRSTFQPLLQCLSMTQRGARWSTRWGPQGRLCELGLDGLTDVGILYGRLAIASLGGAPRQSFSMVKNKR